MAACLAFGHRQRLFAECVARALAAEGFEVERADLSTRDGLRRRVLEGGPLVYLVDGVTFESSGGAALVDRVHERGGKILIVAGGHPRVNSSSCSTACADGVVSAAEDLSALLSAVRFAASGNQDEPDGSEESASAATNAEAELARGLLASLSPRERIVLARIMTGMSAPQIAEAEFVAVPTVRSQIRSILGKLQVNSQLAAVALAHRAGWNAAMLHNHQI